MRILHCGGKPDNECGSFARFAVDIDDAVVLVYDLFHHEKPQARTFSMGFGGEQGIENFTYILLIYSRSSGIGNCQENFFLRGAG